MLHKIIAHKVIGDRERYGQVLINLLSNAIKYSPTAKRIIISSNTHDHKIFISVQDFGIGIPKDKQEYVFQRYYRVQAEKLDTYPGLGLGLYITREIVKRQGGDISFKSQEGKGSTFTFSIPLRQIAK